MQIDGEPQEIDTPVNINFKLIEKVTITSNIFSPRCICYQEFNPQWLIGKVSW